MLVAVLVRFTNFTDDLLTHSTGTIKLCLDESNENGQTTV